METLDRLETTAVISLSAIGMAAFADAALARPADVEYAPFALLDQPPASSDALTPVPSLAPILTAAAPVANAPPVPATVVQAPLLNASLFTANPLASDAVSSLQSDLFTLRLAALGFTDAAPQNGAGQSTTPSAPGNASAAAANTPTAFPAASTTPATSAAAPSPALAPETSDYGTGSGFNSAPSSGGGGSGASTIKVTGGLSVYAIEGGLANIFPQQPMSSAGVSGGESAFVRSSTDRSEKPGFGITNLDSGGEKRYVMALDAPGISFDTVHPTTGTQWVSTKGGLSFVNYLSVFSTDFTRSYAVLGKVPWGVQFVGTNVAGTWTATNQAKISVYDHINIKDYPQPAGRVRLQPYSPTYQDETNNNKFNYTNP